MKHNKKILMIATTALFTVGCIGLIGAMKYQNMKTEASDIKETDVAKAGVDASSDCLEGETPYIEDDNNNLQLVTKDEYEYILGTLVPFCVIGNSKEFPITQKRPLSRTSCRQVVRISSLFM